MCRTYASRTFETIELACTQQNLLRARQQRDDAEQCMPPTHYLSHRSYHAYTVTRRLERPRHTNLRFRFGPPHHASGPLPVTKPRKGTPRAKTARNNDDTDGDNDGDDRHVHGSDERGDTDGNDCTSRDSYDCCTEHIHGANNTQRSNDKLTGDSLDGRMHQSEPLPLQTCPMAFF